MGHASRTADAPLSRVAGLGPAGAAERMAAEPWGLDLVSTVANLERLEPDRPRVGSSADPSSEAVRFTRGAWPGEEPGEVSRVRPAQGGTSAEVEVGRSGPMAASDLLPLHLIGRIQDLAASGDPAPLDLLGEVDARLIGLTYRAWAETRPASLRERAAGSGRPDRFTAALLDLAGLEGECPEAGTSLPHEALAAYAGLLSLPSRPPSGLERLLRAAFRLEVEVVPFRRSYLELPADEAARLGRQTVPDVTRLVLLRIGPIGLDRLRSLLEGGGLRAILTMGRRYLGDQIDAEVEILLSRPEVPESKWGGPGDAPLLGVETWLGAGPPSFGDGVISIPRATCRRIELGGTIRPVSEASSGSGR